MPLRAFELRTQRDSAIHQKHNRDGGSVHTLVVFICMSLWGVRVKHKQTQHAGEHARVQQLELKRNMMADGSSIPADSIPLVVYDVSANCFIRQNASIILFSPVSLSGYAWPSK